MNNGSHRDEKLPKREVIKKQDDFRNILQNGKRWHGSCLRFFFLKAEERRIGFAVSKRFGKAVYRNKVKRLMREGYRRNKNSIGSFMMIMMPHAGINQIDYYCIEKDIQNFIHYIKR